MPPSPLDSATDFSGVTPQPPWGTLGFVLLRPESRAPVLGHFARQHVNTLTGSDVPTADADAAHSSPARRPVVCRAPAVACRGEQGPEPAGALGRERQHQGGAAVSGRGTVSPWVSHWSRPGDRCRQL